MPDESPERWKAPEGGSNYVAIKTTTYEARHQKVDHFFGRPLSKYSHDLTFEHVSYAIFSFKLKEEAVKFMKDFDGEPFDPRDKGRGSKWMFWYKGRAARRKRSPYDFR